MISPKKQKFIDYIKNFTKSKGRPPTFVEIMNGLNYNTIQILIKNNPNIF